MTGWAGLQMGEAGHERAGVLLGLRDERRLQRLEGGGRGPVDRVAHPELEVGRDLVVARARGVQAPGRLADELGEPRLDVHVDVFERCEKRKRPASISLRIVPRPRTIARPSFLLMMP